LGFRGPEIETEKPPGVFRVIFVGASVVEAQHLPEEEMFAFIVERRLNELVAEGTRVEVVVDAGYGRTSHVTLSHVANRLLPLNPDLIIELSAADMWAALPERYEPTMYWKSSPPLEKQLGDWLEENSGLVRAVQRLSSGFTSNTSHLRRAQLRRSAEPIKDPPDEILFRDAERSYLNIHRSALLARDANVDYAIMTQAWLYKPVQPEEEEDTLWLLRRAGWNLTTATARRSIDQYNRGLRELAREDGLLLIDLAQRIPRNLEHYVDDVHLTAKGHEAAAAAILESVIGSEILTSYLASADPIP
jgi:hypothetical protein